MRFIENHILPFHLVEVLLIRDYKLIAGDENMERRISVIAQRLAVPELAKRCSVFHVAPVRQDFQRGRKFGDLLLPVVQRRGRCYNEERAPNVVCLGEIGHQRDRLYRLRHRSCQILPRCSGYFVLTFPRPISSAKIPLIPCSYKLASQFRPLSWYSFSWHVSIEGCLTETSPAIVGFWKFISSTTSRSSAVLSA